VADANTGGTGIMHPWLIWLGGIGLFLLGCYIAGVVVSAKTETKEAPRTQMFTCDRHGAVPASCLIHLDVGLENSVDYCPFCFNDKMKAAKNASHR
jgi:hypothetical protein